MATQDISRFLLQPNKHYSSLHMQQGRVIVDSDWNERAAIEAEERRVTILDLVCVRGTPNDGFPISLSENPAVRDVDLSTPEDEFYKTYDFDIGGGSYFVGGMRLAIDGPEGKESFLGQGDWLQVTSSSAFMPARPVAGMGENTRHDLVYLCAWEQPVTAVEDSELVEVALGARDTSTRVKRMRRFMVKSDVSGNCADAFTDLLTELGGRGDFNADTGELVSKARLRVAAAELPNVADPCADPAASGYVGADNQTIRVELRAGAEGVHDGKLIWGFDNASKLYRVQVDGTTVSCLTTPQDLASMPRKGQVVEFLQWGAKLPNHEKVAEAQGLVTKVTGTYDPQTRQLQIDAVAELADWNAWLAANPGHYNPDDPSGTEQYLYMRVWDRGADLASTAEIDFDLDVPVDLGATGLQVVIEALGQPGDFWIVAARPSTPDVVTPWDLHAEAGVAPHGPRRFYAPLGLISVTDSNPLTYATQDCRTRLRKLCEGGPCTVTVGDGIHSFGHFDSLQAAVDAVGDFSKICVLPGHYEGQTVISGFEGLIIEGSGARSVLENAKPSAVNTDFGAFESPVISIKDSQHVFIRDLAIIGHSAVGVEIAADEGTCRSIKLERLRVASDGEYTSDATGAPISWWLPAPCITVANASRVEILDCEITMADVLGLSFAVVLGGDALSMRGCEVSAPPKGQLSAALGGVNIRSGSRNVEIIGCEIWGGWGHGVALGHGRMFDSGPAPSLSEVLGSKVTAGVAESSVPEGESPSDCDCEHGGGLVVSSAFDRGEEEPIFLPAGVVEDVRIYDNRIHDMGLSGVSTTLFWPLAVNPVFIVVTDLDVARNVIEDNVKLNLDPQLFLNGAVAVGGVCLAASTNAWIHENTIRNNGVTVESVPVCGVGMIAAMNAVVEDNQIVDNGVRPTVDDQRMEQRGLRGGVVFFEASAVRTKSKQVAMGEQMPSFPSGLHGEVPYEGLKDWTTASSQSAITVRGNEVSHPFGRALWVLQGFGPIVVTGNTLQSYGSPVLEDAASNASLRWSFVDYDEGTNGTLQRAAAGACVEISNYGLSQDKPWPESPTPGFPSLQLVDPGHSEVYGGSVLVAGNRMRLEWTRYGGWGASVLVQSLGSVVFNDNASEVKMGNVPSGPPADAWEFVSTIDDQQHAHSFVLTNVFVGARASASVVGNRLTEPQWDALFSAWVAPPAMAKDEALVGEIAASLASSNVGSHCIVARHDGDIAYRVNNVEIYPITGTSSVGPFDCGDVEVSTAGASGESRLVKASLQVGPPPVP
ncbi:MAG: DUF6519 domain-containing protein [Enhygromyxa sp.]